MIVYISIGNSDDKLTQQRWARFLIDVQFAVNEAVADGGEIHGAWFSQPLSVYQNACFCADIPDLKVPGLKSLLITLAAEYQQNSIAWASEPNIEFLGGKP